MVIWSVVVSLLAVNVALAACSVGGVVISIVNIFQGNAGAGVFLLGGALASAGLAIFMFFACRYVGKAMIFLTKKMGILIKRCFVRKKQEEESL